MSDAVAILPILGIAVIAALISVFLKDSKMPVIAVMVVLVAGAVIFIKVLPSLSGLLEEFQQLTQATGLNSYYFTLILKIIGIAYIAEFGAQLCRDSGQGSIALKIEFAAKIGILVIGMPIIAAIVAAVLDLVQ